MPNYTTEDLLLYMYKETSKRKTLAIEKELQTDWILFEKFSALQESMKGLDDIVSSPRTQSVLAILNYANTSAEVEH
jgi:hypothetical protein